MMFWLPCQHELRLFICKFEFDVKNQVLVDNVYINKQSNPLFREIFCFENARFS